MQFFINVAVLASTYVLLAIGYVLVYRSSRVLNLAHGELMMLAAYAAFCLSSVFPRQPAIVVPLTLVAAGVLGILVYWALVRPMAGRPPTAAVLLTVAVGIMLQGLIVLIWSPRVQYPAALLGIVDRPIRLVPGGVISSVGGLGVVTCAVALLALTVFFRRSRLGVQMLAAAENPLLVAQRGVNVHRLIGLAWGLAALNAAIAGVLYSSANRLEGSMALIGMKAFSAAMLGGMGSLAGVLPGAVLVAMAEVAVVQFFSPQLGEAVPFVLLLVVLLVRPWGLYGTPEQIARV